MNMNIDITPANVEDAQGIRYVQKEAWLATYPNPDLGITREDIEAKVNESVGEAGIERLKKRLQDPQESSHTWVAKDSDTVVGFAGAMKFETENKLRALYVLPDYQGQGIGKALMNEVLSWFDSQKKTTLEVVSYNIHAISFYKSFGFKEAGETTNEAANLPSGKILPETLMIKA